MSGKLENLPDISTTQPERLIKYRVSDDGLEAEVLLPGLWYTDFDKKIGGKMSYWSIVKFHESIRWSAMMHGFTHYSTLCHGTNCTLFDASSSYKISEKFHDIRYATHFGARFPTRAKLWVSALGKTSFSITIEVYDLNGNFLSNNVIKVVYVDLDSRKAVKLPLYLLEIYEKSDKKLHSYDIKKSAVPKPQSNSYQLDTKVLHSDCDFNLHVSQVTYLKWCSDAAAEAARGGYFRFIKKHSELYPLKHLEMHYHGETVANDKVVIEVWEDEKDPKCLWATVSCKGKVIYHTKMVYHDGAPAPVEPHLESKL